MKKKFLAMVLVMTIIVSAFGISTAFAKISGSTEVVAGKTYTFKISKSASASTITGNISWSGFASGSETMWKDSGSGMNENITASASISITVPAGTPAGSTCTISVSGQISTFDGTNVGESSYSESKTLVVVKKTSSATPDSKPASNNPEASKAPTEWDIAKEKIAGMEEGGSLTLDITGDDHTLSAKTYQSLLDKKGVFTFNFGTYSCILNAAQLGALGEGVKALDLGLSFESDPDFSAAVGNQDTYQLHFAHSGEFPGKIAFKFKADKNAPGDTVYLYYYYGTSKVIEGVQTAVVDADGFVTFDIYHCSDYFVSSAAIEGASGIIVQAAPEPTPEPTTEPTPTPAPTPTPEPTSEPDQTVLAAPSGFPLPVLIAVGAGAALIAVVVTMLLFRVGPFRPKRTRISE